jgi:hypothetical protein
VVLHILDKGGLDEARVSQKQWAMNNNKQAKRINKKTFKVHWEGNRLRLHKITK